MTSSYSTVLDSVNLPPIPPGMLQGMNRRKSANKLHESINHEYYRKPDGWITVAEGHETIQAQTLINVKGFQRLPGMPRPDINSEMQHPWMALLRHPQGPSMFPVQQVISNRWHQNPPIVQVCRQPLTEDLHPEHVAECFKRVEFQQLLGTRIEEATCNVCRAYFVSVDGAPGMSAAVQLKKHQEVSHTRMMQNNDIAEKLAEAFKAMGAMPGQSTGLSTDDVIKIATAVAVAVSNNQGQPATPAAILEELRDQPVQFNEPVLTPNPEPVGTESEGPSQKKRLQDFNRAELEAHAEKHGIDIRGLDTNAAILAKIRESAVS